MRKFIIIWLLMILMLCSCVNQAIQNTSPQGGNSQPTASEPDSKEDNQGKEQKHTTVPDQEQNNPEVIKFKDPVFEQILRKAWNKEKDVITIQDVSKIKTFYLMKIGGMPYYTMFFSEYSLDIQKMDEFTNLDEEFNKAFGENSYYKASYFDSYTNSTDKSDPPITSLEDLNYFTNLEWLCFYSDNVNDYIISHTSAALPSIDMIAWEKLINLKGLIIEGKFEETFKGEYTYTLLGDPPIDCSKIVKAKNLQRIILDHVTANRLNAFNDLKQLYFIYLDYIYYNDQVITCRNDFIRQEDGRIVIRRKPDSEILLE